MKPHYVKVTIESVSEGVVNQEVTFIEYAVTAEELVKKHFAISEGIVSGVIGATKELAAPFLKK
jgi:hypothetical protein